MAQEIKRFYRSRTDRVLFGVCGGLGKYFGVDPVLFRLLFVLAFLMNGAGIFLYAVAVLVTQAEPASAGQPGGLEGEVDEFADKLDRKARELAGEIKPGQAESSRTGLGLALILVGLFFLAQEFNLLGWVDAGVMWGLLVIVFGFYIIFKK